MGFNRIVNTMLKKYLEVLKNKWSEFILNWPELKERLKLGFIKFAKRRKRKFQRVFEKPKKLMKWIVYVIIMIKTKPTPRRLLRFARWCVIRFGSFIRSSIVIVLTENWDHQDAKFYLIVNCILFFFIKLWQEIRFNFDCPLAILLYGPLVKKDRSKKKEMEAKKKQKFHKFVADPFQAKIERTKKMDKQREVMKIKMDQKLKDLEVLRKKRSKWKKKNAVWLKKLKKQRRKIRR